MPCLTRLPYEVLANVVYRLNVDDIFSLAESCKSLEFIIREERICKTMVQGMIPHSEEARKAIADDGGYATALRRLVKRRNALATANPFIVATIGFADAFLYCNGFLCYTLDRKVRVLDIHHSASHEIVLDVPSLFRRALLKHGEYSAGIFAVLYFSEDIISCLYTTAGANSAAYLISLNMTSERILIAEEIESTEKIFVRHNKHFLYYGTHSELGTDGYKKWVLHGYEFATEKWFDKMHLPDLVGSEIDSTVCFEFHNNYLYALSNQTTFEVEEIDWTSFYHCLRFPLACPGLKYLEVTDNQRMWRRQHQEGPIDDRWTNLRLDVEESTGKLKIVESRKEWYMGASRSQRTYYTTDIIFPQPGDEDRPSTPVGSRKASSDLRQGAQNISTMANTSGALSGPSASSAVVTIPAAIDSRPRRNSPQRKFPSLPDDPLTKLLQPDDNPNHITAPARLPKDTHPGNDGSAHSTFTLNKSLVRQYHMNANAYIDLVDDPLPSDWQSTQRLRLRAGSRKLGPPLVHGHSHPEKAGLLREPSDDLSTALAEMYREIPIRFWPPAQDPDTPDHDLDALYRVLNPPSHLGNVEGTADGRSLIYVTGTHEKPQAIIFVGFDPAIKLPGLKRWGGLEPKGIGEGPHINGRAKGADWREESTRKMVVDVDEADREMKVNIKGKGKSIEPCGLALSNAEAQVNISLSGEAGRSSRGEEQNFTWKERAMYMDIGLGYYFGLDKK